MNCPFRPSWEFKKCATYGHNDNGLDGSRSALFTIFCHSLRMSIPIDSPVANAQRKKSMYSSLSSPA